MRIILTLPDGRKTSISTETIADIVELPEEVLRTENTEEIFAFTTIYRTNSPNPLLVREDIEQITAMINGEKP